MKQAKKPRVKRLSLRQHKVTKLQVVVLAGLVVLVGAAVVYRSFAGSNAKFVPKNVSNLRNYGRAIQVNPSATGGYTMDGFGQLYAFSIGVNGRAPFALPTSHYSSARDEARDFVVLNWSNPAVLILSKDGQLHTVGNNHNVNQESVTTSTARKIIMYDSQRGYVLDGSGRFARFSVDGVSLPPAVSRFEPRTGQDVVRSAVINPNKQWGYLVTGDGSVHEFSIGSGGAAPAISAGTTWPDVDKAIDITMSNWSSRQGYVVASDGGWYSFNGAPNDYTRKSGAPFNFGTSIRGFYQVAGKAAFEVSKEGTVYVFSLPNYLVAQNDKEIYPQAPKPTTKPFSIGSPLKYGYYRMPAAPNGEYSFYDPKVSPFNTQPTPDRVGTLIHERCGRAELLRLVYNVSKKWQDTYGKDGSRVNVGDLNSPGHISHSNGVDVDLRTTNLSAFNAPNAKKYPQVRDRTVQMSKWLIDGGAKLLLYNDTAVFNAVNSYGRSKGLNYNVMQYYDNHDEHVHVRIGLRTIANNPSALTTTSGCPQ